MEKFAIMTQRTHVHYRKLYNSRKQKKNTQSVCLRRKINPDAKSIGFPQSQSAEKDD